MSTDQERSLVYGLAIRARHDIRLPVDRVWVDGEGAVEAAAVGVTPDEQVLDMVGRAESIWTGVFGWVENPVFFPGPIEVAKRLNISGALQMVGDGLESTQSTAEALPETASVLDATNCRGVAQDRERPALGAMCP